MAWFVREKQNIEDTSPAYMPDGLWTKCPKCSEMIYKQQLEEYYYTCFKCKHHFRISGLDYISYIIDEGTFKESHTKLKSADPLNFSDTKAYPKRLDDANTKTNLNDAITTGFGKIHGSDVIIAVMNFNFIGGSMGSVVGEKIFRAAKDAIHEKCPLIIISASGGARMQEAALSLMQMPKTAAILAELGNAGLPFISLLTDPTTGGTSASYAMLGDVILAEPGALIGFAGPRVIEQTIRKKLPPGFQRAETVIETGFIDMIVPRPELKDTLRKIIDWIKK
ncbi:MAG: acetyl-CoA carboxylase subunit beta [Ignavibacteria bacterium GWF2_33_9]|nr:MAG: acetyl-CoA carboxylase subunit beta [Ignavibacteria bacterium GWF2_33_9]